MSGRVDTPSRTKVPPASLEAEQAVLGGLMLAPAALGKIQDWLQPEDFYRRDHQLILQGMLELNGKSKPFDAVTLGEWFEAQGMAEQVANGAYLIDLATTTPSAANIVAYAEIVREKAVLRRLIEIGTGLANDGFDPDGRDTGEIISSASRALTELKGDPRSGGLELASAGLTDWFQDLQRRYDCGSKVTGLPYPWLDVNEATHGLQPGELTIIAGRPSMGKSVMALNIALFTALRGHNVALFSLEMTTRQVNRRNISALSGVPHEWLLAPEDGENGECDAYWGRVQVAIQKLRDAPLWVDESAGIRVDQLIARARRRHMQRRIELIVLDHGSDMTLPGKREARFEVGEIASAGKMLAKEFGCPAVWLFQLNRDLEKRADKRPVMADLRESGELEQKADVIWFPFRQDYYDRNNPGFEPVGDVELILGKGRDLRVGAPVILRADLECMAFRDWEGVKPDRTLRAQAPRAKGRRDDDL